MMRSTVFVASMVEGREHQVPGLGGRERNLHGFPIAHLADQNHLRRLTERGALGEREARCVRMQLALMNRRLLCGCMNLDRSSMVRMCSARLAGWVDDGRQRRRLARSPLAL